MIISLSGKIKSGKDLVGQIIQHLITWKKYPIKESYLDDVLLSLHGNIDNNKSCSFEIKKFADKLKDMVCLMIGCTREQLEDREFRDKPLGEEWNCWINNSSKINNPPQLSIDKPDDFFNDMGGVSYRQLTPRLLLQLLGTEAGRNIIHPDVWVNSLMSEYKINITQPAKFGGTAIGGYPNWIITDNRFPNETKRVKKEGGITIRIERDFNLRFPEYQNLEEVQVKDNELYKQLTHFSETALDNHTEFDYVIQNNGSLENLIEQIRIILTKENII